MDHPGGKPITDIDLMLFHTMERTLYNRLTRIHGRNPDRTKLVVAMWMWFESIGHQEFIRHLYAFPDEIVLEFVREAELCLEVLLNPDFLITDENNDLPFMASQRSEPLDLKFFAFNRDVVMRGVRRMVEGICHLIFDEVRQREAEEVSARAVDTLQPRLKALEEMEREAPAKAGGTTVGGGSSSTVPLLPPPPPPLPLSAQTLAPPPAPQLVAPAPSPLLPSPPPPSRSTLNPMASPWHPSIGQSSDDHRSMFITFSKGHPLSREDITDFFNARYGPCVEAVMIEKAAMGMPPMYGRVIFTSASMIAVVLNGQRTAKFMIKGKHLWARMYVPRHGGGH